MRKSLICALWPWTAAYAQGQETCSSRVGERIKPQPFNAVVAGFAKLTPKGEFETTAQYESRKAREIGPAVGPVIISKAPDDRKYFEYDADRGVLRILTYAFQNQPFDTWSAFYTAGLNGKVEADTYSNIEVVISSVNTVTGSYPATNGFGAKFQVDRVHRITHVIFDAKSDQMSHGLFPSADESPYVVGELPVSPEDARQMKTGIKLALVVTPKDPFIVRGTMKTGETTLQRPFNVTEDFVILIADIRCGLVTDATNRVIGAYPTR